MAACHSNGSLGGTTEVYAYRCVSPETAVTLVVTPMSLAPRPTPTAHDAALEAAQGLHAILELFAARYRVTVEVDGHPFGAWVATTPFNHRATVRVTPIERQP